MLEVAFNGGGHGGVQESLRKYSVVPVVVRELSADDEIEGYAVPAGATVICHLQVWRTAQSHGCGMG